MLLLLAPAAKHHSMGQHTCCSILQDLLAQLDLALVAHKVATEPAKANSRGHPCRFCHKPVRSGNSRVRVHPAAFTVRRSLLMPEGAGGVRLGLAGVDGGHASRGFERYRDCLQAFCFSL